jgi:gamma-glutamyltranspeptidase / glutathione hydrolase
MPMRYDRREVLKLAAGGAAVGLMGMRLRAEELRGQGHVEGQPVAAKVGMTVLAEGGNAVDAIVAAALTVAVVAPHQTGPGGYGGHVTLALDGGKKITAIDFNSAAPAASRPDMFALNAEGKVKGNVNQHGWLAAGVPGILAGLQLALDRYGTKGFAELVGPAIHFARDGFLVDGSLMGSLRATRASLVNDTATARIYLPDGELPKAGATLRNPDLAAMLDELAKAKSVEPFYRGEIAKRIAAAFKKNGGLVTEEDLAAYRAREVEPLDWSWRGQSLRTPPPSAGGATVIEALAILKALHWDEWPPDDFRSQRGALEALRLAWDDRLKYLGDPGKGDGPVGRLLGEEHIKKLAGKVEQALKDGKPVPTETDGRGASGTVHLSAADGKGNWAALTLTHGGAFGAQVTVPGLGLTLGHGMFRFDPRPDHPNAPGPGKRPLHNMCPTIVLREGKPVLAVGGRGGRRIPNALFEVLAHYVGRGTSIEEALAKPRLHTEGGLKVELEQGWPDATATKFKEAGYTMARAPSAYVSAVWAEAKSGAIRGASR